MSAGADARDARETQERSEVSAGAEARDARETQERSEVSAGAEATRCPRSAGPSPR